MSVLMASSSTPSVAFAADLFSDGSAVEFTTEETVTEADVFDTEADAEDAVLQAGEVTDYRTNFLYGKKEGQDLVVEYEALYEDETVAYKKTTTATMEVITECDKIPQVVLKATIEGKTFTYVTDKGSWSNGVFTVDKKTEHDWQDTGKVEYDGKVNHGDTVTVYPVLKCSKCGETKRDTEHSSLSTVDHDWDSTVTYVAVENIKKDDKGNVVLENGTPVLADESKAGSYRKEIRCKDYDTDGGVKYLDKDGKESKEAVTITIAAKKVAYATVTAKENIKNASAFADKKYQSSELPLKESDIVLEKCDKKGSYTITYYSEYGEVVDETTISVDPHHVAADPVASFDSKKYGSIFSWDVKDHKLVVKNSSCNVTVPYDEVVKCVSCGTVLTKTAQEAKPQGSHLINTKIKDKITQMEKDGTTAAELEKLAEVTKTQNNYINVTNDTSTCDEAGTVTVEYLCTVCKEVAQTQTVKVAKKNHAKTTNKVENLVEATCTAEGSYDVVTYCDYCGKVMGTKSVVLSKLKHTNEGKTDDKAAEVEFVGNLVIDRNGKIEKLAGKDSNAVSALASAYDDNVYAQAYTLCETCGEYKEKVGTPVIKVEKVTREGKTCQPGSITLTATYTKTSKDVKGEKVVVTKTFDYYSSKTAYQGRTAHDPAPAVKENVVEATATENGSYDEVVYCSVCGTEISRKTVTVTATGEVILPAVTGLKATATGTKRVALSWDAVEGAEGYFIIGFGENRTGSQIAYTTRTSWTDTAADSDAFNFYWVQPFNRNAAGKIVKGELGGYKYALGRVVAATSKVTATATEDGIELNWAAVSGANSYVVMSKTGSADAEFNASVATDTTTYVDTTAASGEVTYYWVYATYKNADGKVLAAGKTSPFAWAIAK